MVSTLLLLKFKGRGERGEYILKIFLARGKVKNLTFFWVVHLFGGKAKFSGSGGRQPPRINMREINYRIIWANCVLFIGILSQNVSECYAWIHNQHLTEHSVIDMVFFAQPQYVYKKFLSKYMVRVCLVLNDRRLECELYHIKHLSLHSLAKRKLWDITFSIKISTYVWDEFMCQREVQAWCLWLFL